MFGFDDILIYLFLHFFYDLLSVTIILINIKEYKSSNTHILINNKF